MQPAPEPELHAIVRDLGGRSLPCLSPVDVAKAIRFVQSAVEPVHSVHLAAQMGFPRRPRARPVQGSSDDTTSQSTLNSLPNAKRAKLNDDAKSQEEALLFDRESIKIYIVIAKLSPDDVRDLTRTIESNGGAVVDDFHACTLALSSTRIWNRLRKYLPPVGYVSS